MKVLVLHNIYKLAGGEDAVVKAECDMLRKFGHQVKLVLVSNDEIKNLSAKIRVATSVAFNAARKEWLDEICGDEEFQIVHIHNFFPLLTPAVHLFAARRGLAVVQTLHNYRLICANGIFVRERKICEKCGIGNNSFAVLHRCYRDSVVGSLAVVRMQRSARKLLDLDGNVDRFIVLTNFAKQKFIRAGFNGSKFCVKPNFAMPNADAELPNEQITKNTQKRTGFLFIGRISEEKGIRFLINAWRRVPRQTLQIAGDGPLREELSKLAPPNVKFLMHLSKSEIDALLSTTLALIVPSICYEGFPMVVVEAFQKGVPIIGTDIGALSEIIDDRETGRKFAVGAEDELISILSEFVEDEGLSHRMGESARVHFDKKYSAEANILLLENIYAQALKSSYARTQCSS